MISSDGAKAVVILGAAGFGAYVLWKLYEGAKETANTISETVPRIARESVADAKSGTRMALSNTGPDGSPMYYDPLSLGLYAGNQAYQAGLGLYDSITGKASAGKTYDDMVGYVLPSTVQSTPPEYAPPMYPEYVL